MNNYVSVGWSDGDLECYPNYDSNLVRVSSVDVNITEDSISTYITYTPTFFTDDALLSLVDAVATSNKQVNKTHAKSELVETHPYPAMYFSFDLADGLDDLAEREAKADMSIFADYFNDGDEYTYEDLTEKYLPRNRTVTCLGIEITYDRILNRWTLPDGSAVSYPAVVCSTEKKPAWIDGINAVIKYMIRERNK